MLLLLLFGYLKILLEISMLNFSLIFGELEETRGRKGAVKGSNGVLLFRFPLKVKEIKMMLNLFALRWDTFEVIFKGRNDLKLGKMCRCFFFLS